MSAELTFAKLRTENVGRCEEAFGRVVAEYGSANWVTACAEELGEIARLVKRLNDGRLSAAVVTPQLGHEIADLVMYLDLLAASFGIDLAEALREKFAEVSLRVGSERSLDAR